MSESLLPELAALLAETLPDPPTIGLRERKKAAAMRRLQEIAVAQFEEHGFDQVTIEHIAEHAEVSPSSVYRYFGTKEALVLRDEYDDFVLALAPRLFATHDPWTACAQAIRLLAGTHFVTDGLSMRRMKLWHETPSVRAAGFVVLDQTARRLAGIMHSHDRYGHSLSDYEILSAGLVTAIFTCLEQWYLDGGVSDVADQLVHAIELVRPAWATAD